MQSAVQRPERKPQWYHSVLIQLFPNVFFQGTSQPKCQIFENSQNPRGQHKRPSRATCSHRATSLRTMIYGLIPMRYCQNKAYVQNQSTN